MAKDHSTDQKNNSLDELWNSFGNKAEPEWKKLLLLPDGAPQLGEALSRKFDPYKVAEMGSEERTIWEGIGAIYRTNGHWQNAIAIYSYLYKHFINGQLDTGVRIHKGMPLVWLSDCYLNLGNIPLSKKYLMLTLIEDAIAQKGTPHPVTLGSYFRLSWRFWMSDNEFNRYFSKAFEIYSQNSTDSLFPEYILQEFDNQWMVEIPSPNDMSLFITNNIYIDYLINHLGDKSGIYLERLAEYLLSCIPGCRTARRKKSYSTDYDIVCSIECPDVDYRSELGRYFICECKDWKVPVNFSSIAKFIRVLDSIKAKFGIIFSEHGVTGMEDTTNAYRELIKAYQDRGMVIAVITLEDLKYISQSGNFISLLRNRYERVRLDLP